VQRGGFASERDAAEALERELERLRRELRIARSLTLAELVEVYLVQQTVEPVTIEKAAQAARKGGCCLRRSTVSEIRSEEIAAWRISLSPGYRFDATQAVRHVLARAVVWRCSMSTPRSSAWPTRRRDEGAQHLHVHRDEEHRARPVPLDEVEQELGVPPPHHRQAAVHSAPAPGRAIALVACAIESLPPRLVTSLRSR